MEAEITREATEAPSGETSNGDRPMASPLMAAHQAHEPQNDGVRVAVASAGTTSSMPRNERVTVDRRLRMRFNGESTQQMAHAEAIKAAGGVSLNASDGNDTSKDQEWVYDVSPFAQWSDRYVLLTTALFLGPKLLVLAIPMLLCHLPPMLLVRLYISVFPDNTERISRSRSFYVLAFISLLLSIPAIIVILLSYAFDCICYWFLGILFCTCTCRWKQTWASMRKIDPYRNGPPIVRHLSDFFVCCMGQCARQSAGETLYMVACMWLLMPWLKYYVCCNPWIYNLDHRMVQQISTTMSDLGSAADVATTARGIISLARQKRSTAKRLDIWSFVPHYPYPPPNRRWALGLQAGGSTYPAKFTLIVHTTHASAEAKHCTEQFVISNSVAEPVYRVMLWYNNPFHFLTGWVEASISTGEPSQPHKRHGGEHPMWLVSSPTPLVSGRDSFTGSGMIDSFFDYWLPVFVHECRRLTYSERFKNEEKGDELALQIADAWYQEVHSEDGVSRPTSFVGRLNYSAKDALTDFNKNNEGERNHLVGHVADVLSSLADTRVGRWAHVQFQGADLHEPGQILEMAESFERKRVTDVEGFRERVEEKAEQVREVVAGQTARRISKE